MGNTEKNEYQFLRLPEEASGAQPEEATKKSIEMTGEVSLSMTFLDGQDERKERPPVEQAAEPVSVPAEAPVETPFAEPVSISAEQAEVPLPEEPDLEALARQIREEMEQEGAQQPEESIRPEESAQPEENTPPEDAGAEPVDDTESDDEPDPEDAEETPEEAWLRRLRGVFEYVETFCVALAVMIILFLYVFRYVSVDGDSMLPTLHGGDSSDHADRLIISDFLYEPKTGDIVVINTGTSGQPLIKRVIAVGGQTVRIDFDAWEVTVDGVRLEEDYIWRREGLPMEDRDMGWLYGIDENGVCEFTVGEGKVFVMGDNRNNSKDSRFREIGEQDVEHILGKVVLRLYPLGEFGSV